MNRRPLSRVDRRSRRRRRVLALARWLHRSTREEKLLDGAPRCLLEKLGRPVQEVER